MKKTFFFLLFCLLACIPSNARLIKVLAIGNSFSQDAVEQYLYELAAAQGDSLVIKVVGGIRSNKKNSSLRTIIRDEQWDIITLQQASQLSGIPESFSNLALLKRLVFSYTTNLHVQFAWHMTWAYADDFTSNNFAAYDYNQRKMYSAIVSTMLNVLPAVSIQSVIPSGTAIQLTRYRLGDTLNRDGYHLSYTLGRYTAACTWCEFLTGKIVDGNKYRPESISEEEAQICQECAHEAMFMQERNRYALF